LEKLPFYAIAVATASATYLAQTQAGALDLSDLSLLERLAVAINAHAFYLVKFVAPISLVPLYPFDEEISLLAWKYWSSLGVLVALTAVAVCLRHRAPVIGAAFAFHLITLLPVLGLLQFGHHSAADRFTYLPMLGPAIVLGSGAALAWRVGGRVRWSAVSLTVVLLTVLGWRTLTQIFVWEDSVSLWTHVVTAYPESAIASYNLGHGLLMAGDEVQSETEWKRTLTLDSTQPSALYELGALLGRNGRYKESEPYFRAVVSANPDHLKGRINLAMVLDELGDLQGASEHYREFLRTATPSFEGFAEMARSRLAEIDSAEAR
jgi:tetratricopeptide (TPR) repeat protein